ncbi:YheC/YheD family protein [Cytobacillus sp. IB215316]|uniref:YheC/YheD family endospore coat-associated protein n=1 Tax=Cytobacillus sp. IB215316 TaxID=3097354 RepID=UPI002A0FCA58|nr:YheC/YheD family protein [Cytobacillus sp. IB215316]MDX8363344.1 YheC/YheD family protein [Cytobacillus sp. IB215316]
MKQFGFLTLLPNQERGYATEIAKHAEAFNITVYRLTPLSIDPNTELVHGEKFDLTTNTWVQDTFPIPTVLYDRCFYSQNEISTRSKPIVNWLKTRPDTIFLGYGLPNKWEIYKILNNDPILSHYIPKTEKVTSRHKVIQYLRKTKQVLLKPESGSQGRGVISLSVKDQYIEAKTHRKEKVITKQFQHKSEFISWLTKLLTVQSYLMQPLLSLHDEKHRPFDIRILLQKNEQGHWVERGRGIRRGQQNDLISNIHGGGMYIPFKNWMDALSTNTNNIIKDELETIIDRVPQILERQFSELFELGIDIGLDQDNKIWLIDTNSKPGRSVIFQLNSNKESELFTAPLLYCQHLTKNLTTS